MWARSFQSTFTANTWVSESSLPDACVTQFSNALDDTSLTHHQEGPRRELPVH